MPRRTPLAALGIIVGAAVLAGCSPAAETHDEADPAVVEQIGETDLHRITLTERAAERLAIQTTPAEMAAIDGSSGQRLVIPYSAVFYASDGATYAYINPEALVFERTPIEVDYIADDLAVLVDGDEGMTVVSVGVVELFGAESGLGAGDH